MHLRKSHLVDIAHDCMQIQYFELIALSLLLSSILVPQVGCRPFPRSYMLLNHLKWLLQQRHQEFVVDCMRLDVGDFEHPFLEKQGISNVVSSKQMELVMSLLKFDEVLQRKSPFLD